MGETEDDFVKQYDRENALFSDKIYLRFGIEKEDFQLAFEKYDLAEEQYVQDRQLDVTNSVPVSLPDRIASKLLSD